jgi:hypothetical protein
MSKLGENEKLVHALVDKKCMPDDAASCLVMTCDPFFDGTMPHLNGLPDAKVGKSITSVVTQELQISAPPGTLSNWSMHIQTNPWTADPILPPGLNAGNGANFYGNYVEFPAVPKNPLLRWPSVSVWRGPDGNPLGPFDADDPGNVPAIGVGMPDNYAKGVGRLIGMAMEYYDTTAPLYRSGSVRCYEQPTNAFESKSFIAYANPSSGAGPITQSGGSTAILLRRPPRTPAEANLLLGTVGWKAEMGFYAVLNPIEAEIPAKTVDDTQPVMFDSDFTSGVRGIAPADVITGSTQLLPSAPNARANTPMTVWNMVPYNMKGAMFTGLNPSHTGLLRVRYIYERFPSPDEADIALAAQPCAECCFEYFEIKSRMLRDQPVAVPVEENFLGEWLYNAISTVFPMMKRAIHAITAPEQEVSQESKDISKLANAVNKLAVQRQPPVIAGSANASSNPGVTRFRANTRRRAKRKVKQPSNPPKKVAGK